MRDIKIEEVYDEYTDFAMGIVNAWNAYLIQIGAIHGMLAYGEELGFLIAKDVRILMDQKKGELSVTEKDIIETSNGEQTGE